jgi:hypothetical protein
VGIISIGKYRCFLAMACFNTFSQLLLTASIAWEKKRLGCHPNSGYCDHLFPIQIQNLSHIHGIMGAP